jgi:hypothetical protein
MKIRPVTAPLILALLLCFVLTPAALAASADKEAPAAASESNEALEAGLKKFAEETIASINRCILPSEGKKEVLSNGNGSFTARYIAIDPRSIKVSVTKATNPGVVKYIGYMRYSENEYACTAPSKAAASKGPFLVQRSENLTELVKYLNGKWSY